MIINIIEILNSYLSLEIIMVIVFFIIVTSAMILYDIKKDYKWDDLTIEDNSDVIVDNI